MPASELPGPPTQAPRQIKLRRHRLRSFAVKLSCLHRPASLPSPKENTITVVCVSDTHGTQPPLPEGDILLHAGDLTQWGTYDEIQAQLTWLSRQHHKYKVVIAGNHDLFLDEDFRRRHVERWRQAQDSADSRALGIEESRRSSDLDWGNVIYLQETTALLAFRDRQRTIKVFGSPLTPQHGTSAFQHSKGADVWTKHVPADTDILLTHGPPWGHLDGVKRSGCTFLAKEVARVRPRLVVYGHIHVGYGQEERVFDDVGIAEEAILGGWGGWQTLVVMAANVALGWLIPQRLRSAQGKTTFVNAAVVEGWQNYKVKNEAVVLTI